MTFRVYGSPGQSISRILSSRSGLATVPAWAIISLGEASPPRSSSLPETSTSSDVAILGCLTDEQSIVSAWPCSRRGLPGRAHYWTRRWSFTPPFHHHLAAVCFCGPIRQVTGGFHRPPPRVLPGAVLSGVRTFLDAALQRRDRPTNLGIFIILYFITKRQSLGQTAIQGCGLFKILFGLPKCWTNQPLSSKITRRN